MICRNTRGSEWRKWDLHIHTPGTAKNDQFISKDDAWKVFIDKIEEDQDYAVFGITDYFSMENYLKIIDIQKSGKLTKKYFIPNIELRILPVTSTDVPINIHVLFNPKVEYDVLRRNFFSQMEFEYDGSKYSCNREEIVELGRKYLKNNSESEKTAYEEGINQFNISFDKLREILNSKALTGQFLVGVANSNRDGNSGIQDSSLCATRREIYKISDFIFSSNPNDTKYFLGEGCDTKDIIISNYGSIKPCISCSDAHAFEDMFKAPKSRFTWIKADPTFEGLKQIIYEPKSRVSQQEERPEQKTDYQIIDSITFDNTDIGKQKIQFNANLNTIIGGRSSGKSILLGCVARLSGIKTEIKKDNKDYNEYIITLCNHAVVNWKDDSKADERKIEYYRQSEINGYAAKQGEIDRIVQKIINRDESKKKSLDEYFSFLTTQQKNINNKIVEYIEQRTKIVELKEQSLEIGNKEGIEKEILKLEKELDEIKKKIAISFSEEDLTKFNELKKELSVIEQENITCNRDKELFLKIISCKITTEITNDITAISQDQRDLLIAFYDALQKRVESEWADYINTVVSNLDERIATNILKTNSITSDPLFIQGNNFLLENLLYSQKEEELTNEQKKKAEILIIENELVEVLKNKVKTEENILSLQQNYYLRITEVTSLLGVIKDGVSITAEVLINQKKFNEKASNVFNQKSGSGKNYIDQDYSVVETFQSALKNIFFQLDNGEIVIKNGNFQSALTTLFSESYYDFTFRINYEGDDLDKMSEGKKAFIVLRLLLDFDESPWPILIDQPEDDLDNRAIYDELVAYLRDKKKKRQIILVTHNPNIVVGTDAELVIVANQNGIQTENQDGLKFEYLCGALEDSMKACDKESPVLISQGIREHVCDILEGGDIAFQIREKKYGYK